MVGIKRPTIEPDIGTIAARLHKALGAVVAGLARSGRDRAKICSSPRSAQYSQIAVFQPVGTCGSPNRCQRAGNTNAPNAYRHTCAPPLRSARTTPAASAPTQPQLPPPAPQLGNLQRDSPARSRRWVMSYAHQTAVNARPRRRARSPGPQILAAPSGVRVHPLPNDHPLAAGFVLDLFRLRHTNGAGEHRPPFPIRLGANAPLAGEYARPPYVIRQPRH